MINENITQKFIKLRNDTADIAENLFNFLNKFDYILETKEV